MKAILNQLKSWRARWRIDPPEDDLLNRAFAVTFSRGDGVAVLDYLIEKYFQPLEFIGASDLGRLGERNGQMLLMVDIMKRFDKGMHPSAFEPERGSDDGKEVDVRMMKNA